MWTESHGVIGVGYEGRTLDQVVTELRGWGVTTLVDVRLNAISRKRGFSKKALTEGLEAAGIAYVHLPALGNPRDNREHFADTDTDDAHRARETFRQTMSAPAAAEAIDVLVRLSSETHVAVFCYEQSELHCHRREVLAAVRDRLMALV